MAALIALLLLSCGPDPVQTKELSPTEALRYLTRASLDLRGVRPSLAELRAVQADPGSAQSRALAYLAQPGFGERYAGWMAGVWLTPVSEIDHDVATYPVDDPLPMLVSLGMEPLKVLARVVEEDLPYTEVVTADWTVIDEHLATSFPTDYPAEGVGWQVVHYTDGRPKAGVLSTNGFWWRYDTTLANANRGRANAITRVFTCHDYLATPIEGNRELNLLDEEAIADALRTDPACVACHVDLDPIAAYLWGFYNHFAFSPSEQARYHAERELLWEQYSGVSPGWFGEPGSSLSDLGVQLASDPRFVECAVERTMEQLLSRPAGQEDTAALTRHREAFIAGELSVRNLVASVIADPSYREAETRLLTPHQLARSVEDLTGYRFHTDGLDAFKADLYGLRSLAGGLGPSWDGEATVEPTATSLLVQERLAQAAGAWLAANDLADPAGARLLQRVDGSERPETHPAEMEAQVRDLYLRILSRELAPGDPLAELELARALDLWGAIHAATGSEVDAWGGLVAALLRDPDLVLY